MQLAIAQNPHVKNPKELWDILNSYDRVFDPNADKLDKAGFAILKDKLRSSKRIMVK